MHTGTCLTPKISAAAATFAHLHAESMLLELLAEAAAIDRKAQDLGDLLEMDGRGWTCAELWDGGPLGVAEAHVVAQFAMAGDVAALRSLIGTQTALLRPVAGILDSPTSEVPDLTYALAVQAWSAWTVDAVTSFDADELLDLGADREDLARWLAAARDRGPWSATEVLALDIAGIDG